MVRKFSIHYNIFEGDKILFLYKYSKTDSFQTLEMTSNEGVHTIEENSGRELYYRYALVNGLGQITERHDRHIPATEVDTIYYDIWRSPEAGSDALRATSFAEAIFGKCNHRLASSPGQNTITISLDEVRLEPNQAFCIVAKQITNWNTQNAIVMKPHANYNWQVTIEKVPILKELEFKFGIWDTHNNCFVRYEDGMNRTIKIKDGSVAEVFTFNDFYYSKPWRAGGVAVPVFSLRTTHSRGCGEFSDLKPLADWCEQAHLKVIQLLPINDTTATFQWQDSYPYNAISVMALHPSYISVLEVYEYYGKRLTSLEKENGLYLNDINYSDYNRTMEWKRRTLLELFEKNFDTIIADEQLQKYLQKNAWWLKDYAGFAVYRNKNNTPDFHQWKEKYSKQLIENLFKPSSEDYQEAMFRVFLQYHLENQLVSAIEYAHAKHIAIKGDLPIGINPKSVEAWVEPHLFNFGLQAGAPPDYFSRDGQNWGFPTYNWDVMAKDGFAWWKKRLGRMEQFFDAFRIDHILGMFRIWAIPTAFKSGIMGIFSPALPLTVEEIKNRGFNAPLEDVTIPRFTKARIHELLGEIADGVIKDMFEPIGGEMLQLKREYFSHESTGNWIENNVPMTIRDRIRNGFGVILHDVLFVSIKDGEWHPRMMAPETEVFKRLSYDDQNALRAIHDDYFFNRHNVFWREQGAEHLDGLLKNCEMLVCGEDLGMIPDSVPEVMRRMQILALELQRMPKFNWDRYGNCAGYQYMSVAATSSHDISNIRGWWEENKNETQWYYNNILGHKGEAPRVAQEDTVAEVIQQHLDSPSMLCINPIQDYAGMVDNMPHLLPREERINEPSNANNMWRYRVPFNVDHLTTAYHLLSERVKEALEKAGRD